MRYLVVLVLIFCAAAAAAQPWEDRRRFGPEAGDGPVLRILSSTDTAFFEPILARFLSERPGVAIDYFVTGTADVDRRFRADPGAYDLVISSAMDLQLKLANDGFALPLAEIAHPAWAQWRQSLFAFTTEPAAIVVNRTAFAKGAVPKTRQALIEVLRAEPERFRDRIGTYDVRESGLGYLFATQDARVTETYWRLTEVMGALGTRLYCCSGEMIDDLSDGTILVAYNVLGSYAAARADTTDDLQIVLPSDFPTTMMRTAFVSERTEHGNLAAAFVRHLLEREPEDASDESYPLPALAPVADGQSAIVLGPALITYLDALKRRTFLREWEDAIIQRP
ncbi:ABC transporter substrate-binding protein [Jannaschia marina]|uniref:ABC transporter substrate-binding protein n=1 Tax=Jannaschia marina TaxID=2741674 RepID=UPI0015CD937B|nr:extracellular solute-binding protein [Jannaschia marina]